MSDRNLKPKKTASRKSKSASTIAALPAVDTRANVEPLVAIHARLDSLEARVASLDPNAARNDLAQSAAAMPLPGGKFWLIEKVLRAAEASNNDSGGVAFGGQVVLPMGETYAWQVEDDTSDLLASDWAIAHAPLAALAHPIRLLILKALLEGKRDTQSLASLPDMGTTGQLYHHLKELESAGWIRQPRRGEYIVLAERVVPLLAILSACEVTQR